MYEEVIVNGILIATLIILFIILIAMIVPTIIGLWKVYKKANKPGWAVLVPIYADYVFLKTVKMKWYHLLILEPLMIMSFIENDIIMIIGTIGIYVYQFIMNIKLSKSFGKSTRFGVFTTFFPFIGYMILGYGNATYQEK